MASVSVDLDRAARVLDLERRLESVPATALIRGIYFRQIEDELRARGLVMNSDWSTVRRPRIHALYGLRDYLRSAATAAALISPDPREGLRQLFYGSATYCTRTWFGRVFLRFLKPDPAAAMDWLERCRDFMVNYGHWRLERRGPEHLVLHMFDEYIWIDSMHVGGCEGLLAACGVDGTVRAELDGPFHGRLKVRWSLRN
jgi:uncharacterized protein (TIGR02265 family)